MDLGLTGRNAMVAGGSSGLGLGTARALVGEGANVSICGRDAGRLAAAIDELQQHAVDGARVHGAEVDVRDDAGLVRWVGDVEAALGPVDIAVANAGGPPKGDADEVDVDDYRRALELNLMPSIVLTEHVLPGMRRRGWGRVLFITSVSVLDPLPGLALSNVARPGLVGYARSLVDVLDGDSGSVTVNVLAPGPHATPRVSASTGHGRLGDPHDFGAVAAFVCSRQAAYVHGAVIAVDGGAHGGAA
ncbi:SDR family NAD(P)-dependent oxidoreductase [Nitriliruptor alkaliphilus]|uniref:SDR family NAD(P)-dependent oxidoreductase n=1 Tax=Nitriliruptor alkaliphilus TaxID=427918 RepID=UPI000695A47A|nr:SDR family NAD(P)-dependent oxidoreductase [Nitriliruptor alkaliphilus]